MKLIVKNSGQILANHVSIADTIYTRCMGLLGKSSWNTFDCLWLTPCNSIHMWFMKFPIDVIFVNQDLVIKQMLHSVKPWQNPIIEATAHSVFELPAGTLSKDLVSLGSELLLTDTIAH